MWVILICIAGFFSALIALILFIIRSKQSKTAKTFAFISFIFMILFFAGGVFWAGRWAVNFVEKIFSPRSGIEIYTALFDKPDTDCVKVNRHMDQVIPIMDVAICLDVTCCPAELNRVLARDNYDTMKVVSGPELTEFPDWFRMAEIKDSLVVAVRKNPEGSGGQNIYFMPNRTRFFVYDYIQ